MLRVRDGCAAFDIPPILGDFLILSEPTAIQEFVQQAQLIFSGIFVYHAVQVYRMSKSTPLVPYTGVIEMAIAAGAYYLLYSFYHLDLGAFGVRTLAQLIWISGSAAIYFQVHAFASYLNLQSRIVSWVKIVILASTSIAVASLLSHLLFDRMFLLSPEPMITGPYNIPESAWRYFSPNIVGAAVASLAAAAELLIFPYFLKILISRRSDRWLIFGLTLAVLGILNDLYIAGRTDSRGFSFLFIATFVEIVRLTILIERANQDRFRRVEHSMRLAQIGELSATVAHELGTPLTVIMAHSEIAMRKKSDPEVIDKAFRRIREAAEKAISIARSLRDHARVYDMTLEALDLHHVIQEIQGLMQPVFQLDGIQVRVEIDQNTSPVLADRQRLLQALMNLLENARDATEGQTDRQIIISAGNTGDKEDKVRIAVADNGRGIPEEIRDRLFTPFFSTKPLGKGTGIGLAFTKTQLHSMQGRLTYYPRSPGTTFEILLRKFHF